jgi:hypothetical protein
MTLFRRKDPKVTPAPLRRPGASSGGSRSGSTSAKAEAELNDNIRVRVRAMLTTNLKDAQRIRQAEDGLRRLTGKHDAYIVASKIGMQMEVFKRSGNHDETVRFRQVFALMSDLILEHIHRELETVQDEKPALGPNIFTTYCAELLENVLYGKGFSCVVDTPIQLADYLLAKAIDAPSLRAIYLAMAEAALRCARDQADKAVLQGNPFREEDDITETANPGKDVRRKGALYTAEICAQIEAIAEHFSALEAGAMPGRQAVSSTMSFDEAAQYLAYLQQVINIGRMVGYLPFCAQIEERAAFVLSLRTPDKARHSLHSAAKNYEKQGNREAENFLPELAAHRHRKAHALYLKCQDAKSAQRVKKD